MANPIGFAGDASGGPEANGPDYGYVDEEASSEGEAESASSSSRTPASSSARTLSESPDAKLGPASGADGMYAITLGTEGGKLISAQLVREREQFLLFQAGATSHRDGDHCFDDAVQPARIIPRHPASELEQIGGQRGKRMHHLRDAFQFLQRKIHRCPNFAHDAEFEYIEQRHAHRLSRREVEDFLAEGELHRALALVVDEQGAVARMLDQVRT